MGWLLEACKFFLLRFSNRCFLMETTKKNHHRGENIVKNNLENNFNCQFTHINYVFSHLFYSPDICGCIFSLFSPTCIFLEIPVVEKL